MTSQVDPKHLQTHTLVLAKWILTPKNVKYLTREINKSINNTLQRLQFCFIAFDVFFFLHYEKNNFF